MSGAAERRHFSASLAWWSSLDPCDTISTSPLELGLLPPAPAHADADSAKTPVAIGGGGGGHCSSPADACSAKTPVLRASLSAVCGGRALFSAFDQGCYFTHESLPWSLRSYGCKKSSVLAKQCYFTNNNLVPGRYCLQWVTIRVPS